MSKTIERICDSVDEAEYQAEIARNERELKKHKWIRNPHELAVTHADLLFGRANEAEFVPVDWSKYQLIQ